MKREFDQLDRDLHKEIYDIQEILLGDLTNICDQVEGGLVLT